MVINYVSFVQIKYLLLSVLGVISSAFKTFGGTKTTSPLAQTRYLIASPFVAFEGAPPPYPFVSTSFMDGPYRISLRWVFCIVNGRTLETQPLLDSKVSATTALKWKLFSYFKRRLQSVEHHPVHTALELRKSLLASSSSTSCALPSFGVWPKLYVYPKYYKKYVHFEANIFTYLFICTWFLQLLSLKYQVWWTGFVSQLNWIFLPAIACKIQVWNRQKIKFIKLNISNWRIAKIECK